MSILPLQSGVNYLISNVPFGSILTCYNSAAVGWAGSISDNFTLSEWTLTEIAVGVWTIQEILTGYYLGLADNGISAVCAPNTASTSWGISNTSMSNTDLTLNVFEPSDASMKLVLSQDSPVSGISVVLARNSNQAWTFQLQ